MQRVRVFGGLSVVFGCLAVLLAGGCMVGPNYQRPEVAVPDRWTEATTQPASQPSDEDLGQWWTVLNDPMLDSLIERAIDSNLSLQIAMERVREARAQRGVVAADLWPQVNIGAAYTYRGSSLNASPKLETSSGGSGATGPISITPGSNGGPPTITFQPGRSSGAGASIPQFSRDQSLFQAGFDASWELDVFGGTRRAIEAADALIEVAREDSRDVLVTLISEVALNYVQARGYQRRIQIAQENVRIQEDTVSLTKTLFESGLTNELDLAQARAQLAATRSQIPVFEVAYRLVVHQLGVLLGREPGALTEELSQVRPIPAVPPQVPAGLPSDLLRRRPDIRSSERQLAAATAQIGVATADLFPRFSLNGTFGPQTRDIRYLLDRNSLLWSVGPSVSWPIFDGGRIVSNIEVQDSRQKQVLNAYRLIILAALAEVEDSLVAYEQELLRHKDIAESLEASRRAVQLSDELYRTGIADFLSVLISQRNVYLAEDQLAESETTSATRLIALYKALGGGWQGEEGEEGVVSGQARAGGRGENRQ